MNRSALRTCWGTVVVAAGWGLAATASGQCVTPTDGMVLTADTTLCSGSYHLTNGLSIAADNIVVSGATSDATVLYGDGIGNGLTVDDRQHVTVSDLTIRAYYNGMHFRGCDYARIEYCAVANCYNDCRVQPCDFLDIFDDPEGSGNSYGHAIWLRYCNHATLRYNVLNLQQNGISLFDCEDALVESNFASHHTGWGITLYNTNHSTIQNNIADDCTRIGAGYTGGDAAALLMVMGSSYNQVLDNSFRRGGDGLFLAGYRIYKLPCANNYFARNDCSESPNNGFEATFSYGNVFDNNITDRCNYGYWLGYSWSTEVRNGQINDCVTAGIAIEHGNTNTIQNNVMNGNSRGIWLWTDPDDDLVQAFPELKDSYGYAIQGNTITGGDSGILCEAIGTNRYSREYTITGNQIDRNAYGIQFNATDSSTLQANFIRNNRARGLSINFGQSNTISNNYFDNSANADAYRMNTWNLAKTPGANIVGGAFLAGNFWSDYAGADTDGDGIGNTNLPYTSGGRILTGGDYLPLFFDDPDCDQNGSPDAGEPDCNGNGIPDACDIAGGFSTDCNANGIPDACDIASGTSADANDDGIPDECQDCNRNDVPDPVDIAGGTSHDCNGDGVPDECNLMNGTSRDCNHNGVPDECDIAGGTSADCNGDAIPDECENAGVYGLRGAYYDHADFTGRVHYRLDQAVDFIWGLLPPWPDFERDTFSVRWTGLIHTLPAAGVYRFYTYTDDGVRLYVNGSRIIDQWVLQGPTEAVGSLELLGDTWYSITLEYFQAGGDANASLYWQPPGQAKSCPAGPRFVPDRDCDGNGVLDHCDVALGTTPDCNGNSVPDACDIAAGTSQDANGDGVPDECADCNHNGVADLLDIQNGTSLDCNGNGIPDECEPDCNQNGVPDDCDVQVHITFEMTMYPDVPAPIWLAVGNLNDDAEADIAVATSTDEDPLWLLFNDGSGNFPTHGMAGPAASEHSVALADFDRDGRVDIALAENFARNVRILRNLGGGSFSETQRISVPADPVSLATGDVDNDGDIDLVVGHWDDFVSVLKNRGNGTFGPAQTYSAGPIAYVVTLGDVDGDSWADIVVANLSDVLVLRNGGDGTFAAAVTYPAGGTAACVALEDFDGDGHLDVVAANEHSDSISLLRNNGDGTFAAPVNYPAGVNPRFLAVADLDGDGRPDVVTANEAGGGLSVFQNRGDGTFRAALNLPLPGGAHVVTAGALNADGLGDVVVGLSGGGLAVLRNTSTATSRDRNHNGIPDECEHLGDMNCDGAVDFGDINPFVLALTSESGYHAAFPNCSWLNGDINGDGAVNFADINPFVAILTQR